MTPLNTLDTQVRLAYNVTFHRHPLQSISMSVSAATGLSITNPLVKYRSLIATRQLLPDETQFRLALHLQKLYDRLKDYEPHVEYGTRLAQISRSLRQAPQAQASLSRPRNWRTLIAAREHQDSLALTRKLTSRESAININSPKGLMLHGDVGTGKSMLVDLFADCLPTSKKRRFHFHTFMLDTFATLESLRRSRESRFSLNSVAEEDDYSLLWLAKELIQTSPILFLDEFQMPDRVASKILTNLMTSFFHLGGVLIATSNRMPEELDKAAGLTFDMPAPSRMESLGWQFGRRWQRRGNGRIYGGNDEFAAFLEVLKARCEVWEMDGCKDYRRLESAQRSVSNDGKLVHEECRVDDDRDFVGIMVRPEETNVMDVDFVPTQNEKVTSSPPYYYISLLDENREATIEMVLNQTSGHHEISWQPSHLKVYGRALRVPRTSSGITMWTFEELCQANLGPADYISIASHYHTLVIIGVPVLKQVMKNEARRFITLLDALYECRCKLLVSAAAGPDELFFPDENDRRLGERDDNGDIVYSETISEVYQDVTAPFRPNVSMDNPNYAEPDPEPDYTHVRLAGLLNADAIEDYPPNKPHRPFGRSFGRTDGGIERKPVDPDEAKCTAGTRRLDFGKTNKFTGEDERFAYRRAQSRLWEMCGARWWARSEPGWHRPLPIEVRRWERSADERGPHPETTVEAVKDAAIGESVPDTNRPAESFKRKPETEENSASPFRTSIEAPPRFSWVHAWGVIKWGPKAGAWGRGPDGLKDRRHK